MGEGSIFKWRGKWAYEYRVQGKTKRITREKKADLVAAKKQILAEQQNLEPNSITVSTYLDEWLKQIKRAKAKNTHRNYRSTVNTHLKPHIGTVRLQDLNAMHIDAMLDGIEGSDGVRQYCHTVLNTALDRAMEMRLIAYNPCTQVEKPRSGHTDKINPYDAEEVKLILAAAVGHRLEALFWLAFTCGIRQGELLGLHWSNVNFDKGKVFIHKQAVEIDGHTSLDVLKTHSSTRHIELTPTTLTKLRERQAMAMREGLASHPLVFASKSGKILHKASLYRHGWTPVIAKAGVEYRNFHQTRHTYATLSLSKGVPLVEVSKILGHASPAQTLTTYAHWVAGYEGLSRDQMTKLIG